MRVSRTFAIVLLLFCTILACSAQVATEDIEPESYHVYSALLSAESARLAVHGPVSVRDLTDRTERTDPASNMQLEKCFAADQVSASAIEDFQYANKRSFRLQDRFDIKSQHKVTSDVLPKFLELSAVGFNPEKTVAIVSLTEVDAPLDRTTVESDKVFYLLRKEQGKWTKVASGCHRRFAILVNVPVEPIQRK